MKNKNRVIPNSNLINDWWISRKIRREQDIELVIRFRIPQSKQVYWKRMNFPETFLNKDSFKSVVLTKLEEKVKEGL